MAFTYKQHENGVSPQKLGERVAIYDRYMVTSGVNDSDVLFYERGVDGVWSIIGVFGTLTPVYIAGESLDLYRDVAVVGVSPIFPPLQSVRVFTSADDFSTYVLLQPGIIGGNFGTSVSVSDNYIAVGSSEIDNQGAVYIYEKTGDDWTAMSSETQKVTADDAGTNQFFGTSVAINEDFLIVGAKGDDQSRGAVYVFKRNEDTGLWEQFQKTIAADGVAGDEFGGQVSISDDYFAVGAENVDLSDTDKDVGAVYIFNYSTRWNELRKITSVNESGLIANNFGHSLDLQGDYLIVGSPGAGDGGVADIFYKKRNWGHLKKVDDILTVSTDNFGESVGISYPYAVIGANTYDTDKGRVYFYEDPEVRLRLAQEFNVAADFLPTKASVYLKRSGSNTSTAWSLSDDRATIIDASNFSTITQSTNKLFFDDRIVSFTGNGYMAMSPDADIVGNDFSVINYPIRNSVPGSYNVWLRVHTGSSDPSGSSVFNAEMLLDGIVVKTINSTIANDEWAWLSTSLVVPDTAQHILGIRLKEKDSVIDKIYIDADKEFTPEGDGTPYATSPYVTTHMKIYDSDGLSPTDPLQVYSYKTTLDEIVQDDWYNFDITILGGDVIESTGGITITSITNFKIPFENGESFIDGNFFLVMSSSGANADNFITWEIIDSDEYLSGSAGLRLTEIALDSSSIDTSLTKRFYYESKAGNADIDTDTWYLDNTKTHAFKIFSDFDPIEDV